MCTKYDSYCKCILCNHQSLVNNVQPFATFLLLGILDTYSSQDFTKIKTFQSLQKVHENFLDSWKRNPHGMSFDCELYNSE